VQRPGDVKSWIAPSPTPRKFEALGLVLRAYETSDAASLFEAVEESRSSLLPWLPWAKSQHLSVEASRESIGVFEAAREQLLHPEMGQVFGALVGIFCGETGELLGGTGVNRINASRLSGEVGYWVRSSRRREGVCTRAAAAMLTWCLLPQCENGFGLRRVNVFAAAPNVASCRVMQKLGVHQFGLARQERFEEGYGWVDLCSWDVLAHEWDTVNHSLKLRGA